MHGWCFQNLSSETTGELFSSQDKTNIETSHTANQICRMILGYETVLKCCPFYCCCHKCYTHEEKGEGNVDASETDEKPLKLSKRELSQQILLWALLANKKEIAEIAWKMAPNQLRKWNLKKK